MDQSLVHVGQVTAQTGEITPREAVRLSEERVESQESLRKSQCLSSNEVNWTTRPWAW